MTPSLLSNDQELSHAISTSTGSPIQIHTQNSTISILETTNLQPEWEKLGDRNIGGVTITDDAPIFRFPDGSTPSHTNSIARIAGALYQYGKTDGNLTQSDYEMESDLIEQCIQLEEMWERILDDIRDAHPGIGDMLDWVRQQIHSDSHTSLLHPAAATLLVFMAFTVASEGEEVADDVWDQISQMSGDTWSRFTETAKDFLNKLMPDDEIKDRAIDFTKANWWKFVIPTVTTIAALKTRIGTAISNKMRDALMELLEEENIESRTKISYNYVHADVSEDEVTLTLNIMDNNIPENTLSEATKDTLLDIARNKLGEHSKNFPTNGIPNIFTDNVNSQKYIPAIRSADTGNAGNLYMKDSEVLELFWHQPSKPYGSAEKPKTMLAALTYEPKVGVIDPTNGEALPMGTKVPGIPVFEKLTQIDRPWYHWLMFTKKNKNPKAPQATQTSKVQPRDSRHQLVLAEQLSQITRKYYFCDTNGIMTAEQVGTNPNNLPTLFDAICAMNTGAIQSFFFDNKVVKIQEKILTLKTARRTLDYHRWIQMFVMYKAFTDQDNHVCIFPIDVI